MIFFDFETYYDGQFSLSKLTYEEYIRDARFEVIGVAVAVDDAEPVWFTGTREETHQWLLQFPWATSGACAHNNAFDAMILSEHFGIRPRLLACTQSMARAIYGLSERLSLAHLGERLLGLIKGKEVHNMLGRTRASLQPHEADAYGEYCRQDVRICRGLYRHLLPCLPREEMLLIDWTLKAGAWCVLELDVGMLNGVVVEEGRRRLELSEQIGFDMNDLRSDENTAYLLQLLGVDPPRKLDTNGGERWAFTKQDVEFLDLRDDPNPLVGAVVEARLASKSTIVSTRAERLRGIAMRGPMPFPLIYYGAPNTGRWSGDQAINLQNLNRGSVLRDAIHAPKGYKLCVADLSQIELRVNMYCAGQTDVLGVLQAGGDVYAHAASAIFGYHVHKDTHPMERFVGKVTELSAGYGCGAERFRTMLRTAARREGKTLQDDSMDFCQRVIYAYRDSHARVRAQWAECQAWLPRMLAGESGELMGCNVVGGVIFLPNGLSIRYPELTQTVEGDFVYRRLYHGTVSWPRIYGPKVDENVVQALSRIVLSRALLRLSNTYYIVGSVHDELIMLVPETCDEQAIVQHVRAEMLAPVDFMPGIPLDTTVDIGYRYGDCK